MCIPKFGMHIPDFEMYIPNFGMENCRHSNPLFCANKEEENGYL